ncbi:ribosome-associated protein [Marinicella litoralis]|uniref:Ribosome-associated protein n=2 Tax=Marinicella litoralis TaxID=644220 RepID=A0A4R6XRY7_9GAMM|nr:ribosome-associated protein [Marinicella litoralis]
MGKKHKDFEITDFNDESEEVSKTQKKQMAVELREVAKLITDMPKSKLAELELPAQFLDAIEEAKRINSHIAKKRHFQFMGKLLIKLDHVGIQEKMLRINNLDGHYQIRDEVITAWIEHFGEHEKPLFEHLFENHPHEEINALRQTLRNYKKKPDNPTSRKKLFQALRSLDKKNELINPLILF